MSMMDEKKEALNEIHKSLERKAKRICGKNEDIILENRLFAVLCGNFELEPTKYAIQLNERYEYHLTGEEVITVLRSQRLSNPYERKEILEWAYEVAELFEKALQGNRKSYDLFEKKRKEPALKNGKHHRTQERMAVIMIYEKFPEMSGEGDAEKLWCLGTALAKYFFYDMADAVANIYGFSSYKIEKKISYEQAVRKAIQLEHSLERTDAMLQELQDEFDEKIEESRVKELTDFFSRLNSEKYGYLLDELLAVRKGIDRLKKENFELPVEINGLLIMIRKLIQFVRDSHIEPIMKVDSIKKVRVADVAFCNYAGTPFQDGNEEKTVRVISPGWVYKDKDLQISRPKIKEEQ